MSTRPFYAAHDLPTCRWTDGARCPRAPEPDGYCIEHSAVIVARAATVTGDYSTPWTPAASARRREAPRLEWLRDALWASHVDDEEAKVAR